MSLLAAACDAAGGPSIEAVTPTQAAPGARVVLSGAHFCGEADQRALPDGRCATPVAGHVDFGLDEPMVRAEVFDWRDTVIEVSVPFNAPVGATDLVVTVNGRSSNSLGFVVL